MNELETNVAKNTTKDIIAKYWDRLYEPINVVTNKKSTKNQYQLTSKTYPDPVLVKDISTSSSYTQTYETKPYSSPRRLCLGGRFAYRIKNDEKVNTRNSISKIKLQEKLAYLCRYQHPSYTTDRRCMYIHSYPMYSYSYILRTDRLFSRCIHQCLDKKRQIFIRKKNQSKS